MDLAHISKRIVAEFVGSGQTVSYKGLAFIEIAVEVVGPVDDGSVFDRK